MSKRLFVGIDMGSSAVKFIVMDESRAIVAQSAVEYAVSQPQPGWVEIDPDIWYRAMLEGLRTVLDDQDPSQVVCLGVTGQMHTTVFLDKAGQSIRPAIMWSDTRSKDMVLQLKAAVSGLANCAHIEQTLSTGSPAVNLYWLKRYEPEHFKRLHTFLIGPDYLTFRLSGQLQTDYCLSSTSSLYDIVGQRWSAEMQRIIGLDASVYPPVRGSAQFAGTILPELAKQLGLPESTPVIVGTGDNAATAVASGCLSGDFPLISLGTSGIVLYPTKSFILGQKGKPILFAAEPSEVYRLVQGAVQSTGSSLSWWIQSILGKASYDRIDRTLTNLGDGSNRLLFYPHLMGDKTLYADPDIRGAFIGIGSHTSRADMTMAVIEGICYAFRELTEGMRVNFGDHPSIKVLGGGARSRTWLQTLANVFNARIDRMTGEVSPAFGIALLSAYATGDIKEFSDITQTQAKPEASFTPMPSAVSKYEGGYRSYLRVYRALKSVLEAS